MATPQRIDLTARPTFRAKWQGLCGHCGLVILPDDLAFYPTNGHRVIGFECCGHLDDDELSPTPEGESVSEDMIKPEQVMPRGKTAKDRCDTCWMVHSPGQTGCDW